MRRSGYIWLLMLAGCSPQHRFEVSSDAPIAEVGARFTNASRVEVQRPAASKAIVTAYSADDSGFIRAQLQDGRRVDCRVGYVTNGDGEPHRMAIRDGRCDGT